MLDLLISQCQIVAGPLADGSAAPLLEGLESLADALPLRASASERLLIRGLVGHVLGRVLDSTGLGNRLDVATAFMAWEASSATSDRWHAELRGLIACCSAVLVNLTGPPTRCAADPRVTRALRLIDARFTDESLTRQDFAAEMHLSVSHATRLLKQQTGLGCFAHIQRRRVDGAAALLRNGRLSVKEIAAEVGYGSANQLGRQFKKLRGMTPVEYRRSASAAGLAAQHKPTTNSTN